MRGRILITCVALLTAGMAPPASASGEPPVATDDSMTATQDESSTTNVLANDTDPEGDALTVTDNTGSAEGGQVDCETDGDCTYTDPGGPCPFSDSFTYTVSDGTGTDTGSVEIDVQCPDGGGGGEAFARTVTFRLEGSLKAVGRLNSENPACEADQLINVQVKDEGQWSKIKSGRTKASGTYSIALDNLFGRYRVNTPLSSAGDDSCKAKTSSARSYFKFDPQTVTDGDDVSGPLDLRSATIDRDAKHFFLTLKTFAKWTRSDLNSPSKRFETYFYLDQGGRYWITVSWGEDLPIVDVTYCEAQCDNANVQFGEGEKLNGKTMRFWIKKTKFPKLGSTIHWQAGSAYQNSQFDSAPNSGSKAYPLS